MVLKKVLNKMVLEREMFRATQVRSCRSFQLSRELPQPSHLRTLQLGFVLLAFATGHTELETDIPLLSCSKNQMS